MRISDWSSDVCSSDLGLRNTGLPLAASGAFRDTPPREPPTRSLQRDSDAEVQDSRRPRRGRQDRAGACRLQRADVRRQGDRCNAPHIGGASAWESIGPYVLIWGVAVSSKNKNYIPLYTS